MDLLHFAWLFWFLVLIKGCISGINKSPFQYPECKLGDSLIRSSSIWASTYRMDNGMPHLARLNDTTGAWTADIPDSKQFIAVNLGALHIMTHVLTQGRQGSDEYVTEFTVEFSTDNETWESYTNDNGFTEVFIGNKDSNSVRENTLMYPIIAQYIKIRPLQWNSRISMRIDVIGCQYMSHSIKTSNDGIVYDMTDTQPRQEDVDLIILRFRTTQEDGLILYADGKEGDFIVMELRRGQLHLLVNLGSTLTVSGVTHVIGGGILNDGRWHDVIYQRNRTKAKLTVDRKETEFRTSGFFHKFRLNGKLYIGGVDNFYRNGLSVRHGLTGCIDFIRFNDINVTGNVKDKASGNKTDTCSVETEMAFSFTTKSSFLRWEQPADDVTSVTFQFKTFDKSAVLLMMDLYQIIGSFEVLVEIDQYGFVYYSITDGQKTIIEDTVQNIDFESNYLEYTDGLWHTFTMYVDSTHVNVTVDGNSRVTSKGLPKNTRYAYIFGGDGIKSSFRGCLRNIKLGPLNFTSSKPDYDVRNVSIGSCDIKDKCIPNPCEHNGICSKDWDTFYCDCGSTGYKGAVCHTSVHPLSCTLHSMQKDISEVTIDPDGSGPIDPFSVTCNAKEPDSIETSIAHNSMTLSTVDGYQAPDYYVHKVRYESDLKGLAEVIENADLCEQGISWKCNNTRLMVQTDSTDDGMSKPYGYWVGRTFQNMFYWGGAAPETYRCACGLTEQGCVSNSTTCNCDSGTGQTEDVGFLKHKEFLPVMELHFGDTGTLTDDKIGQFKLGELKCHGDRMLDNVITFSETDATLEFPTFKGGKAGDIWFQFKTTARDGIMIHDTGDTDDYFIKITLMERHTIQFSYNVGNGIEVLEYRTNESFSDNRWHTVHVERNVKHAWLRVDNFPEVVYDEPLDKITRLMDLTKPLTVGAAVDHRDGFVGCMRGLRVNGVLMDMRGAVHKGQFTYGVHEGCVGKCASSPCFNKGTCREDYSHYTCDCADTPFRGRMCFREVGVNMQTNFMIRHEFDDTQDVPATDFMYIKVGFITKKKQGILIQIRNGNNTEYMSLEMNNNGGVKFLLDVGFERWELNTDVNNIDLTNGQAHEVIFRREQNGRQVYLQVDNYETARGNLGHAISDTIIDDPKFLFIGNNDTENTGKGFEGCIYQVQIDNIYPLKRAFQDPIPPFIQLVPAGVMHETTCEFEEIIQAPEPVEERIYVPACESLAQSPVVDSGGKRLDDSDLLFSLSRHNLTLDSNTTGFLTMTCRVTAADISVIYYILIRQETSPGSGEFECLAMVDSGSMQTQMLHDNLNNTDKEYIVNGSLDKAMTSYPYLSVGIDVLNITSSDARDYMCEVAYKNSSTKVFEKILTMSSIVEDADCVIRDHSQAGCTTVDNQQTEIPEITSTESPEDRKTEKSKDNRTRNGIIGGVIGFIVIVIVAVGCFIYWRRKNKTKGVQLHAPEMTAIYSSRDAE